MSFVHVQDVAMQYYVECSLMSQFNKGWVLKHQETGERLVKTLKVMEVSF